MEMDKLCNYISRTSLIEPSLLVLKEFEKPSTLQQADI